MKLSEYPNSVNSGEVLTDSLESPDEQMEEEDEGRSNSGVFIVEDHGPPSPKSKTSAVISDYLEQVAREDGSSYFVTPPRPFIFSQSAH